MSDAYRSQLEAAEEKVRRAQEEIATLREDKANLERRLSPLQKPANVWVGALGIAALTTAFVAIGMGVYQKRVRAAERAEAAMEQARDKAEAALEREAAVAACQSNVTQCERDLASCRAPPPPPSPQKCSCAPGDPLCTCKFDTSAASIALAVLQVDMQICATEPMHRPFHVSLTFEHDGHVSVATIDSGGDKLTAGERSCITRLGKAAHVPAYTGDPVTVGKMLTLAK